jgi:hypothetical protein
MASVLARDILREYDRLVKLVSGLAHSDRVLKGMDGTGRKVCVADLIAYQIGWGKCLIRWYEAGKRGEIPVMPLEGFPKWDYSAIALHFYQTYRLDGGDGQMKVFERVVLRILEIVDIEGQTGDLDRTGVWPWCSLASGKEWPLSKWIRVNTASPYKRAFLLIKQHRLM